MVGYFLGAICMSNLTNIEEAMTCIKPIMLEDMCDLLEIESTGEFFPNVAKQSLRVRRDACIIFFKSF